MESHICQFLRPGGAEYLQMGPLIEYRSKEDKIYLHSLNSATSLVVHVVERMTAT